MLLLLNKHSIQMTFRLLLLFGSLFIYTSLFSQNYIKGNVLDVNGSALPSASIVLDNGNGTTTDLSGNYRIDAENAQILTISYIGFESQSFQINEIVSPLNVKLDASSYQLSDVKITADQTLMLKKISAYDIKQRPINTSQDVLRIVPGLFIAQHAGGGKAEQIFLRGFDIDHGTDIALSVDGMPVNMVSHAHGQGYSDLHFVIPETIQKVDFNKGTYDASKGDFATAGYADFYTVEKLKNSSIKLEGGQFGTMRSVAMIDLTGKDQLKSNAYVAGEMFLSDGYFESPQNFSRFNVLGKYNTKLSDNTKLNIAASTFTSKWDASGQIPMRAVENGSISRYGAIDNTEGGKTSRTNLNLIQKTSLSPNDFISNQVFITDYDFKLVSNFTFFLNDPVNGDQITQSENRKIYGYKGQYIKDWKVGSTAITSTAGLGFRYDNVDDIRLSKTFKKETILEDLAYGNVDQTSLNAFINKTMTFGNVVLKAGLRYDHFNFVYEDKLTTSNQINSESEGILNPKFSVDFKLNNQLSIFAKVGSGFHSNDTRVVVTQEGNKILPRATGTDIGFVYKPIPSLIINTAAWYLNLEQEFVYVGDEGIVEPSGRTRRKGIDLSIRYQITDWLFADTDINYTNPRALDTPEGEYHIPLAPTFTSIGGLGFDLKNGLKGSFRYRYLADRAANEDNSTIAKGYYLMDAKISYSKPRFEMALVVENLLNREWNEAQFETESRLFDESESVSEIHFTPGSPLFAKASFTIKF